jgi:hypothetical protein
LRVGAVFRVTAIQWAISGALAGTGHAAEVIPPGAIPSEPRAGPVVAHTAGLLVTVRLVEAALWPDPFARPRWSTVRTTFTAPPSFDPRAPAFAWDGDPAWFNLVGHGAMGAELYYRPRRCGFDVAPALLLAVAGSVAWEYVLEGTSRHPSAQDLLYTPLVGLVLGEVRFRAVRSVRRPWLRALLDPLGAVERELGAGC